MLNKRGYGTQPLKDIFNISTKSVKPYENSDVDYLHYSIPAFDDSGKPVLEKGETIKSNKYYLDKNSILVSKLNPRIMRVWKYQNNENEKSVSICSTEFMVYQPKTDQIDLEFYYQYFSSNLFQNELLLLQSGSTGSRLRVTPSHTLEITLPIPPIKEQKKIGAILSLVDVAIDKTEDIIEQSEKVKKGLVKQLLTNGISHKRFKQTEIGEIPEEWEVLRFSEVCKIVNGQVDPTIPPYCDMPHIGNANIEKFSGRLLDFRTAKEDQQISGKYLFNENHVLYGKINPHFSKVTYPKFSGLCSADVYPIESSEKLEPNFLKFLLLEERFTAYTVSVSGRTGIPKVNRKDLEIFKFGIPPLEEQRVICKILNALESKEKVEREKLANLIMIKKGLMQDLLQGKVRVKVDEAEVVKN